MPQNKMIPLIALIALAGLIFLVMTLEPGGWMEKMRSNTTGKMTEPADEDTGSESMESLASDVSSVEAQLKQAQDELNALRQLEKERQEAADKSFSDKLSTTVDSLKKEYDETVSELMKSVRSLSSQVDRNQRSTTQDTGVQYPVGNGMDTGVIENGFRVYRPLGQSTGRSGKNIFSKAADTLNNSANALLAGNPLNPFDGPFDGNGLGDGEAVNAPVYTLPKNATLMGATAMTALIGRVPVNQAVFQPIPFKVIVGRENLTANDMWLPDVERMIFEGKATGEATLKCVRGTVTSVTYVFTDGTIRTVPEDDRSNNTRGIGWISNDQGYPCIPGQFVSDFPKTIAELGIAGTFAGYADAISDAESSVVVSGSAISRVVTGDTTKFALGEGAQSGAEAISRELARRARDRYDAVVIQPGIKLAVHITRQIEIDYERGGDARRINHLARINNSATRHGVD